VYRQLLAFDRGRDVIERMHGAGLPHQAKQRVVWQCVQTALAQATDPVAEILAWFEVLPQDPSLTRARVEWLRLALLKDGRVTEAEQVAELLAAQ
jgi:hypothetical protein